MSAIHRVQQEIKPTLNWFAVKQTVISCIKQDKQTLKRCKADEELRGFVLFLSVFFNTSNMDHFIGYQPKLI